MGQIKERQKNELVTLAEDMFDADAFTALKPLADSITVMRRSGARSAAAVDTPDVGIGIKKIEHLSHIRRMH